MPCEMGILLNADPVYESMEGWQEPTSGCRTWSDLPAKAQEYLDRIAELTNTPIALVGVGSGREQLVIAADDRVGWITRAAEKSRKA